MTVEAENRPMLCPFSPFHCPPVAQAKSQMPSQQWENMSFQGASAIVPNMAGRAHYETEGERQGLCSPVGDGRLHNSTSGLFLGRGYVRSPHLGFKLRERPLLLQQETLSCLYLESPSGLCVCIRTFLEGDRAQGGGWNGGGLRGPWMHQSMPCAEFPDHSYKCSE